MKKKEKTLLNVIGPVFDLSKTFCDQVFDASTVIEAFRQFKENLNQKPSYGYAYNLQNNIDTYDYTYNLQNNIGDISHRVKDVYLKDNNIYADIDIMYTPKGDAIKELINEGMKLHASPSLFIDGNKIEIASIDIYLDTQNSQNLSPLEKV